VLVLDAHDGYWGGRPPLKSIRFVEVPEVSSRINGLLSGEYDFVCDIPPDQIKTIEANAKYEVLGGLITNHRILAYDTTFPALKDPRVRQAMNHAIDRQVIVDELWGGRTKVPRGLQFEFFGPMYVEDWEVPKYDPALAKKLLAEAGYKGEPIPYKVLNNYYTNQVSTAQTMVEMWRAVGLNIEMKMVENAGQLLEKPRAIRDLSSTSFYNDPVSFFAVTFGKTGSMQATGEWTSPETDRLIPELENSTDMARRKAVYRRLLEITERDDPCITVVHQTANFTAKRKDIRWKPAKSFVMDFRGRNFAVALP
jgi:peptide/nickel transport system substrate-binding protein